MNVTKIKAAVRQRDGYECCDCQMSNAQHVKTFGAILDVHRLVPGSAYSLDGCVTVCDPCHRKRHKAINASRTTPRIKGTRQSVFVDMPPELAIAFDQCVRRTRRFKSTEVIIALENHLAEMGLWPLQNQARSA